MKSTRFVVVHATLILAMLLWSGTASALTEYDDPHGNLGSVARIGNIEGWGQYIAWEAGGDCQWQKIGDTAGLSDNTRVDGLGGHDNITVIYSGSVTFCGWEFTPLIYGSHYMDVHGGLGDDNLTGASGDTWFYGEDGDDFLYLQNPAGRLWGGAGNDTLWSSDTGSNEFLYGDSGNDCLWDPNDAFNTMDCGSGTSDGSYPSLGTACESVDACCGLC